MPVAHGEISIRDRPTLVKHGNTTQLLVPPRSCWGMTDNVDLGCAAMSEKHTIQMEIRSIASPDVDFYTWEPTTNAEVFFLVEMEIGEAGVDGADLFQVVVSTPEALRAKSKLGANTIRERSTLIVSNYDWHEINVSLETIVRKCESGTWPASVIQLQRYFRWEYEDYKMEGGS
jgi:hypothetical protein